MSDSASVKTSDSKCSTLRMSLTAAPRASRGLPVASSGVTVTASRPDGHSDLRIGIGLTEIAPPFSVRRSNGTAYFVNSLSMLGASLRQPHGRVRPTAHRVNCQRGIGPLLAVTGSSSTLIFFFTVPFGSSSSTTTFFLTV